MLSTIILEDSSKLPRSKSFSFPKGQRLESTRRTLDFQGESVGETSVEEDKVQSPMMIYGPNRPLEVKDSLRDSKSNG